MALLLCPHPGDVCPMFSTRSWRSLVLPCLLLSAGAVVSRAAEPLPQFKALTGTVRGRIDQLAGEIELENLKEESVNLAGNAAAFLISQTSLSAQEEFDLAADMHKKAYQPRHILPTPRVAQDVLERL